MTKDEINAVVDNLFCTAKMLLQRDGCHVFMAMLFTPKGQIPVSLQEFLEKAERWYAEGKVANACAAKDCIAVAVRNVAKSVDAFGICVIGEVWTLDRSPRGVQIVGGDEPGRADVIGEIPRFSPDRVEALSLTFEFRLPDGSKYEGWRSARFERQKDSSGHERIVFVGEEKRGEGEYWGRFGNFLG